MATKSVNVIARVEPSVKAKAESIMNNLGLPASVVINALYHQIIYTNGIPFSMTIPSRIPSIENITKDEFDSMINSSLEEAIDGKGLPIEEAFDSIRNDIK